MENLAQFISDVARDVDRRLDDLIPSADIEPVRLHEAIRWSTFAGGKRFRPALLIAVGEALGAQRSSMLNAAAAVEMIHTYSLIHDDLPAMDDDELRRGKATCHVKFDVATAILAGDVLQTLAFKAIADCVLPAEVRIGLVSLLADASGTPMGMVAGQQLDIEAEGKVPSIENLAEIHQKKTGALITASALFGALIASASESETAAIRAFGEKLGLLFQMTDDLLDVTQQTATLGKTAGKDISSRKATYPALYGHERTVQMVNSVRHEAIETLHGLNCETQLLEGMAIFAAERNS